MNRKETKKAVSVWVLTFEVNNYDQYGKYFVAAWTEKPTLEELANLFSTGEHRQYFNNPMDALSFLLHLHKGGGRRDTEDTWFFLTEHQQGKTQ